MFFKRSLQNIFLYTIEKKDIYEMQCHSVNPILNFLLLVLSLSWEPLNWTGLERFSLCFSADPFMDFRHIHSEYSSNGRCWHPITQSGLCHNCSCLLGGWHAIRSRRGQCTKTQEASLFTGNRKTGVERDGTANHQLITFTWILN